MNHWEEVGQEDLQEVMKKKKDFIQDHYIGYGFGEPSNSKEGDGEDPSLLWEDSSGLTVLSVGKLGADCSYQ